MFYCIIKMVNDMKNNNNNNKGFTLIELLAVLVVLAIIAGIGGYSIINIVNNTRENNYKLLISEIKDSVGLYYQECKYVNDNCIYDGDNISITLGDLVNNGYLKGNDIDDDDKPILVNPKKDDLLISDCEIKFIFDDVNGDVKIVTATQNVTNSCPIINDYNS